MEKELNIAAILKDKPLYTKLWSPLYGDVFLKRIETTTNGIRVLCKGLDGSLGTDEKPFWKNGKYTLGGEVCLFPSKQMQDWSKFAWEKGDVLTDEERLVVFKGFNTGDYTEFSTSFEYDDGNFRQNLWCVTDEFRKVSDSIAQEVIKNIEKHYGGKLNLSTLEIEKTEFKDGDIVSVVGTYGNTSVCIVKSIDGDKLNYYASNYHINDWLNTDGKIVRPATDSEKQQLFDALAKKGKRWNPDTLQIEDLPKKCGFEPFQKVLVRNAYGDRWLPAFFGASA